MNERKDKLIYLRRLAKKLRGNLKDDKVNEDILENENS